MQGSGAESRSNVAKPEGEGWEGFLPLARFILAAFCAIAVSLNPASLGRNADASRLLIFAYIVYSLLNLIIIRLYRQPGLLWGLCLDVTEVVIVASIVMLTGGVRSSCLGLYLFVLFAAACKRGFNGALLTSCVCVVLLFSDFILPASWSGLAPQFDVGTSFVATLTLAASLIVSACLLGLLVGKNRKRYGDALIITRLVRSVIPEPSFRSTLGNTLESVREHFDADLIRLAIQEIRGDQALAWEVTRLMEKYAKGAKSWKLSESARRAPFAMPPECVLRRLGLGHVAPEEGSGVAAAGSPKRGTHGALLSGLRRFSAPIKYTEEFYDLRIATERHTPVFGSWSLVATSFLFEAKWLGRLTIYNPRKGRSPSADERFLGALVREVAPAVYGKYLVGRLRSRAQARERVRLSQDLHDGIIQSLLGMEMQIDVLRRTQGTACQHSCSILAMGRLQEVVHDEIANLREEMQRIRPLDIKPGRLLDCMVGTVDRFRRELGVSASFIAESQEVLLPPRVCTELVRIVQEALANVRKHSGAHKVRVVFGRENGHYKLSVEDDGRGFGFTGRLSSPALEASSNCPAVIKERVDAIGGELMIESLPGSGARLEILVPLTHNDRASSDD